MVKKLNILPGTVQIDTDVFLRAYELAQTDERTTVWQLTISVSDTEFERINNLVRLWYTEK